MKKILTIVVAAYNKEKMLSRCLDSLIIESSLMEMVQVIVVNDGSADSTLQVAQKYEKDYPGYFTVIDKDNGNYGSVMNTALPLSVGKYFRTLDADDWYNTEDYAKFVKELGDTDADMIITQREDYDSDINEKKRNTPIFGHEVPVWKDINSKEIDWNDITIKGNLNVPHITYKTELLRRSKLHWIEHIFYTDTMFDFWPLRFVNVVRFLPLNVYVYLTGSNDQSTSPVNVRKNLPHFIMVATALIDDFHSNYNKDCPMIHVQYFFISQLMENIYINLFWGDQNRDMVQEIHQKLCTIPFLKEKYVNKKYHGIRYLKDFEKGKLPISFLILRKIRQWKHKLSNH